MLRRKVLSLVTVLMSVFTSGLAVAQDATTPPPAAPPAAEPAPAPAEVVVGDQPATTPAGEEERTEEIVVTGTRIKRKDLTTPAPVTVISRDQIAASGKVRIGDFLQALPEQGNAINTQFNNGGDGATRVSLRGLGAARTLVLINGRRVVPGGTGADASVDLNSIPSQAIERVEILKDGASAVYGSDAIAGVVNLITRKNFEGSNVAAYAGTSSAGDGTAYDLNVTAGTSGERGNLLFSAGYFEQRPIWAGDRDWSGTPRNYSYNSGRTVFGGSVGTPAGLLDLDPAECTTQKCIDVFNDPTNVALNGGAPVTALESFVADPTTASGYRIFQLSDLYNFQPENYLVTPQQRIQLYATGDTNLGNVARGYFEASYVNRQSTQTLAPEPLFADADPLTVSGDSIYNPFGYDLTFVGRRLTEFGRRTFEQDLDTFRIAGGVDGSLPDAFGPLAGWFWDVSLNYGRTQGVSTTSGTLRAPLVQDAIGPSMIDPGVDGIVGNADDVGPVCVRNPGDLATAIPGCVPLNLLGGAGSITPEMASALGFRGTDRGNNQLTSFQVNTSGELFQLLADRPVGLAVGYEYRDLRGAFIPNPIVAAFENTGNNTSPAEGGYHVNEVYGELSIPIVSNLPLVQDLEATVAARYFDYSTFGDDVTYKLGARWRIIPDVTVRGTFSTAFRAPSIADLFSGNFESFESVSDPCAGVDENGDADPIDPASPLGIACGTAINNGDRRIQLADIQGGNPDLEPETADIYTVGVVWEPRFLKTFSATLDYYNISVDNAIDIIGPGTILQGCYPTTAGVASQYCNLISRNPSNNNRITTILDTTTNVGGTDTAGVDLALRYALPTAYGRLGFVFDGTWLSKYDQTLADGTLIEAKGKYDLGPGASLFPEYKFNAGVTWGFKGFGAGVSTRFIGSFEECSNATGGNTGGLCYLEERRAAAGTIPAVRSRDVDAWASTDLFVSYGLRSGLGRTALSVGMNNVFDDNPRTIYAATSTFANSDPTGYDYVGRFVWARLEHQY